MSPKLARAPTPPSRVNRFAMSIDKTSSGLPEVDVHKRTTKVNLSVIIGVLLFFAMMGAVAFWYWNSNR